MLEILEQIKNFFISIFDFIGLALSSLLQLVMQIPKLFAYLVSVFAYIPSFLVPFLIAGIAILIIFKIIGR